MGIRLLCIIIGFALFDLVAILSAMSLLNPMENPYNHSFALSKFTNTEQHNAAFMLFSSEYNQGERDSSGVHRISVPKTVPNTNSTGNTLCNVNLQDNFDEQYDLYDGMTSPNGKWKNIYTGFGSTGSKNVDGRSVFYLLPNASSTPYDTHTHAALVTSTDTFCDFELEVDINTVKQLRQNSPPNSWEVGWIYFRYVDTFHYYSLLLKPNGIELGKKDCDTCTDPVDGQQFLVTKTKPKLKLNTWNNIKVDMVGNHIKVFINDKPVIDYIDKSMSPKLASGQIAMYSEDAYVHYSNMNVNSK